MMGIERFELELMKRFGYKIPRPRYTRRVCQLDFLIDNPPVNDGCAYCAKYRGSHYEFLRRQLVSYPGLPTICHGCRDDIYRALDRIESAFHESGHVVMSIATKRKFDYVEIGRWYSYGGRGKWHGRSGGGNFHLSSPERLTYSLTGRNRRATMKRFLRDLAGTEAEHLLYGDNYWRSFPYRCLKREKIFGPEDDYYEFFRIFGRFRLYEGLHGDLCSTARGILRTHWSHVEKVALALLNGSGTLTYEQVRVLLGLPQGKRREQIGRQVFFPV